VLIVFERPTTNRQQARFWIVSVIDSMTMSAPTPE
jgi:hypothetical protein